MGGGGGGAGGLASFQFSTSEAYKGNSSSFFLSTI